MARHAVLQGEKIKLHASWFSDWLRGLENVSEFPNKRSPLENVSGLNLARSERVKANDKTFMITKQRECYQGSHLVRTGHYPRFVESAWVEFSAL